MTDRWKISKATDGLLYPVSDRGTGENIGAVQRENGRWFAVKPAGTFAEPDGKYLDLTSEERRRDAAESLWAAWRRSRLNGILVNSGEAEALRALIEVALSVDLLDPEANQVGKKLLLILRSGPPRHPKKQRG